jgi:hypothetical protein
MDSIETALASFVTWWKMVRVGAQEAIEQYDDGTLRLMRDDEDVSARAINALRKVVANMDAMITAAERLRQDD